MKRLLALALAALMLAGCGGGGGSSSVPASPAKTQAQTVHGSVVLSIPVASTRTQALKRNVRYPQFVSPNASSVSLSINGGAATSFDVSPSSTLCTTVSGARNCTLSFGAPVGSDSFAFTILSLTGATLAVADSTQTIAAGTAFNFSIALNAVVGTIVVAIPASQGAQNCPAQPTFAGQNYIAEGCAGSGTVTVTVEDPSGATVTGSAPYAAPIALTTNDPALVLSAPQITAPGQAETVTYTGAPFGAGVTNQAIVTATAGGQSAQATFPIRRSYLYVANSNDTIGSGTPPAGGGNISVYPYGFSGGGAPLRTYTGGASLLQDPIKPLVDANGNLYVLDDGIPSGMVYDPTILVYGPQTATGTISPAPIRQITHLGSSIGATSGCTDMVFDPTGQFLFVACAVQVNIFPITANGIASSAVSAEYQNDDLSAQTSLAFDPSGDLYVGDFEDNVIAIVAAPVATTGGYHFTGGGQSIAASSGAWPASLKGISMFIDDTGSLFAPFFYLNSGSGPPDAVAELAIWTGTALPCNNCAPTATLTGTPFTTHAVSDITMDPEGEAYLVNNTTNLISIFSPAAVRGPSAANATPVRTILNTAQGAVGPLGMTVGP